MAGFQVKLNDEKLNLLVLRKKQHIKNVALKYMVPNPLKKINFIYHGCMGSSLLLTGFLSLQQAGATL